MAMNNINTMQAKEESQEAARGSKLTTGHILGIVAPYALMLGFYVAFLTWSIIPGVITAAILAVVGYYVIVPKEINARYFQYGLNQRHSFMSAITQLFGRGSNNSGMTVQSALRQSLTDISGEFKQNIESLMSIVGENGSGHKTHEAFVRIYKKYRGDIWFIDFMEQLETTEYEGIINADEFHDLMHNANQLFDNQFKFAHEKDHQKSLFVVTNVCVLIAAYFVIGKGLGIGNYVKIYAHTGIGWVISAFYIIYVLFLYYIFYRNYYDESITSIK